MFPIGINPQLTASGGQVELAGKTYTLSPLTDKDYGEFENWMRLRPLIIARQNIAAILGITQEEKEVLLREAMRISTEINMASDKGMQIMATLDGAAYMMMLGLRKMHPDMTFDLVREALMDPRTTEAAMAEYERINNMLELMAGGKKGGSRKMKLVDPRLRNAVNSTPTPPLNVGST